MDRRLGRPLPHQLPNPTRADPLAINLSSPEHIRYYSRFPRAIPNQRARSHALLTRPPLTPKGPSDLHVLGLPPAFVLSQDQTLKLKPRITYRVSLTSNLRTSAPDNVRGQSLSPPGHPKTARKKTAKLTPASSENKPLAGRYAKRPTPKRPNRPHIPSSKNMSKSTRTNKTASHTTKMAQPTVNAPRVTVGVTANARYVQFRLSADASRSVGRCLGKASGGRKQKKHSRQ